MAAVSLGDLLLADRRGRAGRSSRSKSYLHDIDVACHLARLAVGADDRQPLGIESRGSRTSMPSGNARCHADGMTGCASPRVNGKLHHLHVEQLAELRIELEPGLVAAVVGLRRAPDWRQELRTPDDLIDHRRHMMLASSRRQGSRGSPRMCCSCSRSSSDAGATQSRSRVVSADFNGRFSRCAAGICSNSSSIDLAPISASMACLIAGTELAIHGWAEALFAFMDRISPRARRILASAPALFNRVYSVSTGVQAESRIIADCPGPVRTRM